MSDNTAMNGEEDEEANSLNAEVEDHESIRTESTISKSLTEIREDFVDEGEIAPALLLVSVRVERELSSRLQDHFDLSVSELEGLGLGTEGLGYYLSRCNQHDLVAEGYRGDLEKLKNERNNLAHEEGHYYTIQTNEQKHEEMRELIENVIQFLRD